jgi:hypothetical protein
MSSSTTHFAETARADSAAEEDDDDDIDDIQSGSDERGLRR